MPLTSAVWLGLDLPSFSRAAPAKRHRDELPWSAGLFGSSAAYHSAGLEFLARHAPGPAARMAEELPGSFHRFCASADVSLLRAGETVFNAMVTTAGARVAPTLPGYT